MKLIQNCVLALSLMTYFLQSAQASNSCVEQYQKNYESKILKFHDNTRATVSVWIVTSALFGVAGYIAYPFLMPLAGIAENNIHDARTQKILGIISEAQYVSEQIERPSYDYVLQSIQEIDEELSRKEQRQIRRQNRQIKRSNRQQVKAARDFLKEMSRAQKEFAKLYQQVNKKVPEVSAQEVAQMILDANESGILCDGSLRYDEDELSYQSMMTVDQDAPKKIQRSARRHNRQVNRHNGKVTKRVTEKNIAFKKHLKDYLIENL